MKAITAPRCGSPATSLRCAKHPPGSTAASAVAPGHDDSGQAPTYRIRASRSWHGAVVGLTFALLAAMFIDFPALFVVLPALGWFLTKHLPLYECADPSCTKLMTADTPWCAGCRRPVARTIQNLSELLDDGGGDDEEERTAA